MAKIEWNKIVDVLQAGLVWFVLGLTAICIAVLILFDTVVGAGFMYGMTQGNTLVSLGISLATTGLLIALMFLGYQATQTSAAGWVLIVAGLFVYAIDTYFDSLGADIMRYGTIVSVANLADVDKNVQIMYRILIGGMSTVGEPLAISIITGMSIVKQIIRNALPHGGGGNTNTPPRTYPMTIPRRS